MNKNPGESAALTAANVRGWRLFIVRFGVSLIAFSTTVYLLLLLVDPYDSGRLFHYQVLGVMDEDPRTANVSRGRDPAFDSAIIGNSRGQMLDPQLLSRETGLRFVQLTVPGTGPREQIAVLRWFVRHHRQIGAIIIVVDPIWCTQDPTPPLEIPFPFWLYGDETPEYLKNLFRMQALNRTWQRMLLWLGLRERGRADGYWNYELGRTWAFRPPLPPRFEPAALPAKTPEIPFPGIERLRADLTDLHSTATLILLMPPTFYLSLPASGDPTAGQIAQCKGALADLAARSHGAFVDFNVDGEIARDPENFMDPIHYRAPIARMMIMSVAAALRSLEVHSAGNLDQAQNSAAPAPPEPTTDQERRQSGTRDDRPASRPIRD